ncbi:MAG: DNA polymerase III subunit delta' [Oceanospirillaceae bacterium]|uniref:DNA polymerase III subunit delta' n=1 Tax=unclassified Thalassolituus TaxID=2624967 RepID=UPI000C495000|nr:MULTISPECIES: DNA polymerase III subunit delta' [unclassified Thalassolituus]MAS25443.1 DNA polymerase III subunit delta' [Oceanospirillaceae bacterium]MBS53279.1 DNA polymerase III subunit delta' [Oceanospirillaceae bacterium]|tara:strand:- start:282 stop:1271 length:990 start_codon:yes stop_codon:yes gene_type:complete
MAILPWQDKIWADITHRHSTSGLPHAMLFAGLEGIGKHELALHTAKWLLCRSPGSSSACGQCHSCQLWDAGSHPDFLSCTPEDGSRQIRIEAIRRVNDFLAQTPQISQCQVVSLHPVEVMNTNAANALLKTLEEPAGESFLLLETERFGSVLPTIRSRCQRIVLNPPSAPESLSWLQQQGVSEDQALIALKANHGAPLKARQWLTSEQGEQEQKRMEQLQQWTSGVAPLSLVAEAWAKQELGDVVGWLYSLLADCVKAAMGIHDADLIFGDRARTLMAGAMPSMTKLITLQDKVKTILSRILSGASSYNKQLVIESLLLEWRDTINPQA